MTLRTRWCDFSTATRHPLDGLLGASWDDEVIRAHADRCSEQQLVDRPCAIEAAYTEALR
jgi:hypothetical protein